VAWRSPSSTQEFNAKLGHQNITDTELALEIERRFGDQLVQKVCIPHGLFMGACLLIAISALKEPPPFVRAPQTKGACRRRASSLRDLLPVQGNIGESLTDGR
jgi:hypothetical protein